MRKLAQVVLVGLAFAGCRSKPPEPPPTPPPTVPKPNDVGPKQPKPRNPETALPPKEQSERGPGEKPLESPR